MGSPTQAGWEPIPGQERLISERTEYMEFYMKTKLIVPINFLLLLTLIAGSESLAQPSPIAFLPETKYEFEAVPEGTKIVHDFILNNTGSAPLHIKKVLTG